MAKTIYPGIPFSPITVLTQPINEEDTIIYVEDSNVFPDGPNIATIGTDENAETISYAQKGDGFLSGCTRGLEGVAKTWQIDEVIARNFTDYDYQALAEAIAQNLKATEILTQEDKSINSSIATINALLNQKADKNKALQTNLYAQYAQDVQAPNLSITPEILFNSPPLDSLALLDHRAVSYVKADRPAGAPPMSSSMSAQHFETLMFKTNRNRALQVATQCYLGEDNGRIFLRTRHRDNNDFSYTGWQAWKEVATCYCADMEWKALPMVNGWINSYTDHAAILKYRKGADGKVIYVEGVIKHPETLTTDNRIFAYLPEGYRPKNYWWKPTVNEYKEGVISIRVNLDGQMYITNAINANIQAIVNTSMPVCLTIPI